MSKSRPKGFLESSTPPERAQVVNSPSSLPLAVAPGSALVASTPCTRCGTLQTGPVCGFCKLGAIKRVRNPYKLPKDSKIRKTALRIVAMKHYGMTNEDIARVLNISKGTIGSYLFRAGRNGWLDTLDDPKDEIEFNLAHKIVENLKSLMNSPDESIRSQVTLEAAKGTIFKKFGEAVQTSQPLVVALKIEMPVGGNQPIREGTLGGSAAYVDGEVAHDSADQH